MGFWINDRLPDYNTNMYQFMDGDRPRNMLTKDFLEYLKILNEMKMKVPGAILIKRHELLPSEDEAVKIENTIYLKGKRFYDAIFINGVTDQALEIAITSAKHFLKIK